MIQDRPKSIAIANPRAGKIRSTRLGYHGLPNACDWRETMHAGHAEVLAYQASCQGHELVIAVGGDGTVHEVLNGLLRNPGNRSALGILPVGTANDFANAIGKRWEGASSDSHRVEIGRMTWSGHTRYFANVTGIGFSGRVAARARKMLRVPARLRYTLALLSQMGPTYGAIPLSMAIDNETFSETPRLMLSIGIGTHEGSYPLNPTAQLDDGWFDVLELRSLRRRDIVRYFPGMLQGHIPKDHPSIHTYRARSIAIESPTLVPFHLDGEFPRGVSPHGLNAFVVELIPQAIDVQLF